MKTTHLRCADRTYAVRLVPHDHHHHEPLPIAQEMLAEAKQHGTLDGIDGVLVVLPPETETDSAYRLHAYTTDADPAAFNGIDAMCAFEAYRTVGGHDAESLALRLGDRVATFTGVGRDQGLIEADLGKPSLEPADARIDVSSFNAIELPHTYEIADDSLDEPIIATLVSLEGLHAVVFTRELEEIPIERVGPAIDALPAFPRGCSTHAAKIESPGEVSLKSWHRGKGVSLASGLGLGAICAAGVTNRCTIESNAARLADGQLAASWDADGHVRLRGRVEAAEPSAA